MPEEILRNLYRIKVPLPGNPLKELNSYLFRDEKRSLLIDTGFNQPECREALFHALDELGVDRDKLDVLGTHLHYDHIGLVTQVVGRDGVIYVGEKDSQWISPQYYWDYWNLMDRRFLMEGFPQEGLDQLVTTNPARVLGPELGWTNYRTITGGDKFYLGGHELEVIDAPGHTPGQICLWIPKEKVMLTADHILFDITPNIAMWPQMEDALGSYLDSLRKFDTYDVALALPGHRESGEYHARIGELLAHHRRRIAECLSVVRAIPGGTAYEIAGRMTWEIRARNWKEFPLTQQWFAVCEGLSHLDYLRKRGKVERVLDGGVHRYLPL